MTVFWDVAPCSLVKSYQRFRDSCCLHHQGDHCPDDGGIKHLRNVVKTRNSSWEHERTVTLRIYFPTCLPKIRAYNIILKQRMSVQGPWAASFSSSYAPGRIMYADWRSNEWVSLWAVNHPYIPELPWEIQNLISNADVLKHTNEHSLS
jgi:hypothetical protein